MSNQVELMDKDETCRFFGGNTRPINHATLYRGIKDGRYPSPIKVGPNSSRWIKRECETALDEIISRRAPPQFNFSGAGVTTPSPIPVPESGAERRTDVRPAAPVNPPEYPPSISST